MERKRGGSRVRRPVRRKSGLYVKNGDSPGGGKETRKKVQKKGGRKKNRENGKKVIVLPTDTLPTRKEEREGTLQLEKERVGHPREKRNIGHSTLGKDCPRRLHPIKVKKRPCQNTTEKNECKKSLQKPERNQPKTRAMGGEKRKERGGAGKKRL